MTICPSCGQEVASDEVICRYCGIPLAPLPSSGDNREGALPTVAKEEASTNEKNQATTYAEERTYPYLMVTTGPQEGQEFVLQRRTRLGRGQDNEIVLDAHKISRHHAIIDVFDWGCTITDLNSANGTFVNGARITGGHQLNEGDEIVLGDASVVYHQPLVMAEPLPPVATPPAGGSPLSVPPAALVPPAPSAPGRGTSILMGILLGVAIFVLIIIILIASGGAWFFLGRGPSTVTPAALASVTATPQPTIATTTAGPPSIESPTFTSTPAPAIAPTGTVSTPVLSPTAVLSAGPTVVSVQMCQAVDEEEKPLDATQIFRPEDTIYCSVQAANLQNSTLSARWYIDDELIYESKPRQELNDSQYVSFRAKLARGEWLVGDYKVEIYLEDVLATQTEFKVRDVTALPLEPRQGTIEGVFNWEDYINEASWTTHASERLNLAVDYPQDWYWEEADDFLSLVMEETGAQVLVSPVLTWKGSTQELATEFFKAMSQDLSEAQQNYSSGDVAVQGGWAIGFSFKNESEVQFQAEIWGLPWQEGGCLMLFDAPIQEWNGASLVFLQIGTSARPLKEKSQPTVEPTPSPTPTPAPLQGRIAYTRYTTGPEEARRQLWIMNLDGSEQRLLTDWASKPSFSPDGRQVAFYGWEGIEGANGVHVISSDGQEHYKVLDDGFAHYVDWSPVSMDIAFSAQRGRRMDIFVITVGDKDEHPIIDGKEPGWSPDGQQIVHWGCQESNCGLFIIRSDGTNKTRLTDGAHDGTPVWSPDGSKIAFISDRDGNWEIYAVSPDGSALTRLTDDAAHDVHPAWLPDSSGLVFHSNRDGAWGIWLMHADGSNPRKIIGTQLSPEWQYDTLDLAP